MLSLADRVAAVTADDVKLLGLIYKLHESYAAVPLTVLESSYRPAAELSERLSRLLELGLVRSLRGAEYMYQLTYRGLDVLAIAQLTRRGVLTRVGDVLAVGKESEVYLGWTPTSSPVILKLHREGTRSFRALARSRRYRSLTGRSLWLDVSVEAAGREFMALVSVRRAGGLVPRPLDRALHAVATEYLDGVELYKARWLDRDSALRVLQDVITTVRLALRVAGIVHGDLSPYNVLVVSGPDGPRGYVIDWPQYLRASDPGAMEALTRDLKALATFFNKSLGLDLTTEELLRAVREEG